jgi:hypothetical protein
MHWVSVGGAPKGALVVRWVGGGDGCVVEVGVAVHVLSVDLVAMLAKR